MKVLVACEESQVVCKAFRERGHEAYSCDLQACSGGHPEWHIQDDCLYHLSEGWDLMIAFPPCDHLSKAGGAHWKKPEKKVAQWEALKFVHILMDAPIERIAIENPVGAINTRIRKPDQRIEPYHFGHQWTKETCLWLKNLPPLRATEIVEPAGNWVKPGNRRPHRKFYERPEGGNGNKKDRSKTFPGIAKAMASQWG